MATSSTPRFDTLTSALSAMAKGFRVGNDYEAGRITLDQARVAMTGDSLTRIDDLRTPARVRHEHSDVAA